MRLSEVIGTAFYEVHTDIKAHGHTYYWLNGGRGSLKSSFASIEVALGLMSDPNANAVIIRKVANNLKDSVYNQMLWAFDKLGVTELWTLRVSPLEMIYRPTGQRILFRGADKPMKLKSTKVAKGYIKYVWYEELAEFNGIEEIRTINQSLLRGGSDFVVLYTYNPPISARNWVNEAVLTVGRDAVTHTSTYLQAPPEWLGEQFINDAEHLKTVNERAYRHEYLGEPVGTGGTVFPNVVARDISDTERNTFERIKRGIDFGYAADPFVYIIANYDKKHKILYIFDEIYKHGLSNQRAAEEILKKGSYRQTIYADSAEPKSIDEMRRYGLRISGAKKSPDSVEYGIKYLQSLESIVIDRRRAPETAKEFLEYELEPDGNGGFRDGYPDKNNHAIDAARYALNDEIYDSHGRILSRKEWGI